jgi:hypothetical protein
MLPRLLGLGPPPPSPPLPISPPLGSTPLTAQEFTSKDIRWKAEALMAMQEAAEYYLVGLFEDA